MDNIPQPLWTPDPSTLDNCKLAKFTEHIKTKYQIELQDYLALLQWSNDNFKEFWQTCLDFCQVTYQADPSKPAVVVESDAIHKKPHWFPHVTLNYAENVLKHAQNHPDKTAIYGSAEGGKRKVLRSWLEMRRHAKAWALEFLRQGVQPGDVVAGYMPNSVYAAEAMLGATWIGAAWTSTSPDFGVSGVLDRFRQSRPKIIIGVDAIWYNEKVYSHLEKLENVAGALDSLTKCYIVPFVNADFSESDLKQQSDLAVVWRPDFTEIDSKAEPEFHPCNFNDPLFVMYSSGTTGAPKCMVHSVGGTVLEHVKEHVLHLDMGPEDNMMYYTTTGWMMWNWLVGALLAGSSIVAYHGSPLKPNASFLWDLIDEFNVTVLGTGAKWLQVLEQKEIKPRNTHNLSSLRAILSTGSPLAPSSYDYVYRDIKQDVMLSSIAGGTDIIGCFFAATSSLPVYRGKLSPPSLGFKVGALDADGNAVSTNSPGDLVVYQPFPSMPRSFLNDVDGKKYNKAYFEKFPEKCIWAHGDFIMFDENMCSVMLGRSDATLNPNGVRFGTADLYSVLETIDWIEDSLAIPQRHPVSLDERVILFVKVKAGATMNIKEIATTIRTQLSARHVPAMALEIEDIPYTISGKKVEVAVRDIVAGKQIAYRESFRNPESLDLYSALVKSGQFEYT